jgi:hypothetical protein
LWDRVFCDIYNTFTEELNKWNERHDIRCTSGKGCPLHQTLVGLWKSFHDLEGFALEDRDLPERPEEQ